MPDAPVLGASAKVALDPATFEVRFNGPLVHESVRAELNARRRGTAATKTRGNVRAPGSIGAAAYPARVFKGIRGPGQMGNKRVTQKGLSVVRVDVENNLLLVRGSVPGPRNGVVEVRTDG